MRRPRLRSHEEVEDSVVDALQANPKLVDSITEQIRFGASQLVPQLLKSFQSSKTLDLGLARYLVEPIQYGNAPVFILKENDPRVRHPYLS